MISLSEDILKFGMNMTKEFEGLKLFPYFDMRGNLTIGFGRNLKENGISTDESDYLFINDYINTESELKYFMNKWDELNDVRKMVLIDICFNIGLTKFQKFVKMLSAIEAKDFKTAAQEIMNSKLEDNRKKTLANYMKKGTL